MSSTSSRSVWPSIAPDSGQLFDVAYTAVAGSEFATELGAYKDSTTNFAGFPQEGPAITLSFTVDYGHQARMTGTRWRPI